MALAPHHKRSGGGGGGLESQTASFIKKRICLQVTKMETNGVLVVTHTHTQSL